MRFHKWNKLAGRKVVAVLVAFIGAAIVWWLA
jgi:hypothetical protein